MLSIFDLWKHRFLLKPFTYSYVCVQLLARSHKHIAQLVLNPNTAMTAFLFLARKKNQTHSSKHNKVIAPNHNIERRRASIIYVDIYWNGFKSPRASAIPLAETPPATLLHISDDDATQRQAVKSMVNLVVGLWTISNRIELTKARQWNVCRNPYIPVHPSVGQLFEYIFYIYYF